MESACANAIENFIKDEKEDALGIITSAITDGPAKLLDVVEILGPYLTNTETGIRVKGTKLLANVVEGVPPEMLNSKEVDVLATFFTDRMKDHHSVTPYVLLGMKSLSKCINLSPESMAKLLRGMFGEIHLQSMAQADRRHFYEMCQYLLHYRLQDVKERGAEFVCGYVQSMDGEKDPRNLLLAFDCVHIIAANMPLDVFTEELFEVVSCYFPIEFTPSPKDPGAVTKEELILGLRRCLVATSKFAEFCLPLLLEKLTSSVQSAKVDALETITVGASTFGPNDMKEYMASFWAAIRREVFSSFSNSLVVASLTALTAIVKCLSEDAIPSQGQSLLDEFLTDVFTDTSRYLKDPEEKHMLSSASLLEASAKASQLSCHKVLSKVFPLLIETFNQYTQANLRKPLLETMLVFISVGNEWTKEQGELLEFKDNLSAVFLSLVSVDSNFALRALAVKGMVGLANGNAVLSSEEFTILATHLLNLSISDASSLVVDEANAGLAFLGKHHPEVVVADVIPVLIERLGSDNLAVLNAISSASAAKLIIERTAPLLLNHIDNLDNSNCAGNAGESACQNLVTIMETSAKLEDMDDIIARFLVDATKLLVKGSNITRSCILNNMNTISCLSKCARLTVPKIGSSHAQQVMEIMINVFKDGNVGSIPDSATLEGISFSPLDPSASEPQAQLITYFSAIVCSVKCPIPYPAAADLTRRLVEMYLSYPHTSAKAASAKCAAGIINRMNPGQEMSEILVSLSNLLAANITNESVPEETKQKSVILLGWLTKALILKSHPQQLQWVNALIDLLKHGEALVAQSAADGFYTILNEFEDIMTPAMNADVKIMYRQRFFTMTLSKVVSGFQAADLQKRTFYLTALSHLLRFVPKQVLATELPDLVPLLLQSLLCDAPQLWLSTLDTFSDLLQDSPDVLIPHIDTLVTHLLKFAQYKSSMKVRLASLQCLSLLTSFPDHVLLPHQTNVTRSLAKCLDDHKRLVRKEAVSARTSWFLIGAPGT